jgi:outer membrane lipoprotein SlyB
MSGFIKHSSMVTALSLCLLAGCQSNPRQRVVVDPKSVDPVAYEKDLAECSTLADSAGKTGSAGTGALGGIFGGSRGAVTMGSGSAVIGGASAAGKESNSKDQILKNCMTGRGYQVLN